MAASEMLREWKMTIILVGQGYKFTKSWHDHKTKTETTYGGRETPIDIGKSKENFHKDGRLKYFNCNIYRHMAKEY